VLETKASTFVKFIQRLQGTLWLTFEDGTRSPWLYHLSETPPQPGWWCAIRERHLC